jgi:hypothetical protein
MAEFNIAWKYTSENEGSDSSYEQFTKWGVTKPFLAFWKIGRPTNEYINTMTRESAGRIVRKTIWEKVVMGDQISDQHLANLLLDLGFNKPKYAIMFACEIFGVDTKLPIQKFRIPQSVINQLNAKPKWSYDRIWHKWWRWTIDSGHFKQGSVIGLSKRLWRYKTYSTVGNPDSLEGVRTAYTETNSGDMRKDLKKYLIRKKALPKLPSAQIGFQEKSDFPIVPVVVTAVAVIGGGAAAWWWYKKRKKAEGNGEK